MLDKNITVPLKGTPGQGINDTLPAFTEDTPGHADYFNAVFKILIDNDVSIAGSGGSVITDLRKNVLDIAIELETLKNAAATGVNANLIVETFLTTQDILDIQGTLKFNAAAQYIYLG